ncbi:MAG: TrbC/VirB2 family protein [Candidatus Nealsonbacteria bacterium]|nr:TrbC/VirB2 family protein [Candidatus Nealsonbacteria bacterium]
MRKEKKYFKIKNIFVVFFLVLLMFQSNAAALAEAWDPGELGNYDVKVDPITKFLNNVIDFLIKVGSGLGVFLLVIAAFYFLTARGDNSKIERARSMVLWVIIGIAVVLLAKLLIDVVAGFIV